MTKYNFGCIIIGLWLLTNARTLLAVSFEATVTLASIAPQTIIIKTLSIHVTQTSHVVAVFLSRWTALISTS